jgi:hypothetical protein
MAKGDLEGAKRSRAMALMALQGFTKQRDELQARISGVPILQIPVESDDDPAAAIKRGKKRGKKGGKKGKK